MDNKRAGSAVITTICLILWFTLRMARCERESHRYDYTYTPSYSYNNSYDIPKYDDNPIDKTQKAIDELLENDSPWFAAVADNDPINVAANTKNPICTALSGADEASARWDVNTSDELLAGDAYEVAAKSPYPIFITNDQDGLPKTSPEATSRSSEMFTKAIDGGTVRAPSLDQKDLLLQVIKMPASSKTVKKVKGIATGQVVVKAWLFDHAEGRLACAGVVAVPKPGKGENALKLTEAQITKLIASAPDALRAVPLPPVEKPE